MNSRLLLSHSSGHGYEILDPKLLRLMASNPPRPSTKPPRTIVEDFWHPLAFQPGHGWSYGPGLDWAGKIVERLSGLKLEAYMRAHIWAPLVMRNLAFDLRTRPDLEPRRVSLSARGGDDGRLAYTDQGYTFPYWERDDHYGGSSVWASAESYLPLLQTLCANDGRVLSPALADELFRPQLGAEAKAALNHTVKAVDLTRRVYGNSFDTHSQEFDHGLGGVVGLRDDADSRRAAGTLSWGGLPNLIWWIDRKTGLCGACFTQLVPVGDVKVNNLMKLFEKAVYERYQADLAKL